MPFTSPIGTPTYTPYSCKDRHFPVTSALLSRDPSGPSTLLPTTLRRRSSCPYPTRGPGRDSLSGLPSTPSGRGSDTHRGRGPVASRGGAVERRSGVGRLGAGGAERGVRRQRREGPRVHEARAVEPADGG